MEAIAIYETLLADIGETSPGDVANRAHAHRVLAMLYRDLKPDDPGHNRTVAKEHLLAALDLRPAKDRAVERRDTLRMLATMEFEDQHWHNALEHFTEAIELSDGLLSRSATEVGKHAEAAESRTLYAPCAYCLIQLRRLDEALEILERGKARMLTEALDWKDIDLANLPEAERSEMRWARDEILSAEAESRMGEASLDSQLHARLGRRLQDAYRHLAAVRHRVRPGPPGPGHTCRPRSPCAASSSWSQPATARATASGLEYPHATSRHQHRHQRSQRVPDPR
jgi:tetratricopeptide (TPR) repeat protein